MNTEARQALKTVGLSTLVVAALVALAWWSMLGLVLVVLGTLLGVAVGWHLGTRHAAAQVGQARQARRRLFDSDFFPAPPLGVGSRPRLGSSRNSTWGQCEPRASNPGEARMPLELARTHVLDPLAQTPLSICSLAHPHQLHQ